MPHVILFLTMLLPAASGSDMCRVRATSRPTLLNNSFRHRVNIDGAIRALPYIQSHGHLVQDLHVRVTIVVW